MKSFPSVLLLNIQKFIYLLIGMMRSMAFEVICMSAFDIELLLLSLLFSYYPPTKENYLHFPLIVIRFLFKMFKVDHYYKTVKLKEKCL